MRQCPALSELLVLPSTARLDGQSLLVLDDEELLLRDIERYKQRQQAPISQGRSGDQDLNGSQLSQSGGNAVKDVLDKVSIARLALMSCACKACHSLYAHKVLFSVQVLIADFFFVCAALAWLVAGAGAKTVLNNSVSIVHVPA